MNHSQIITDSKFLSVMLCVLPVVYSRQYADLPQLIQTK